MSLLYFLCLEKSIIMNMMWYPNNKKSVYCAHFVFFCIPFCLPLPWFPFFSPILPSVSINPITLPPYQNRPILNRNSPSIFVHLSWWQPQNTGAKLHPHQQHTVSVFAPKTPVTIFFIANITFYSSFFVHYPREDSWDKHNAQLL